VAKLTLSVDATVVARAKAHAAPCGTSVSRIVETFLGRLGQTESTAADDLPPSTRRLSGVLEGANLDREDYRRYLTRRYR
jgi:hypothetical protein